MPTARRLGAQAPRPADKAARIILDGMAKNHYRVARRQRREDARQAVPPARRGSCRGVPGQPDEGSPRSVALHLRGGPPRTMAGMALPIARRATRVSLPLVGAFVVGAIAYGGLYTFPALSVAFADEFGISRTLAVTPWTMFLRRDRRREPAPRAARTTSGPTGTCSPPRWSSSPPAGSRSTSPRRSRSSSSPTRCSWRSGLQLSFIGTSTAIARRYAGMSGLALGIAYAGPGLGVAIALPIAGGLIASAGWRSTSLVFLASCLVGVVFVWLMTSGPAIVVPARRRTRRTAAPPTCGVPRRPRFRAQGRPADDPRPTGRSRSASP